MERADELMTIKAFATAAGRSQQAIYKQISTRLAPYVHENDGQKYIDRRALKEIFNLEDIQPIQPIQPSDLNELNNVEQPLNGVLQTTIDLLKEQLQVKDQQIAELNARLAEMSSALVLAQQTAQAAQALHAGTIQQQLNDGDAGDAALDMKAQQPHWWQRIFGR